MNDLLGVICQLFNVLLWPTLSEMLPIFNSPCWILKRMQSDRWCSRRFLKLKTKKRVDVTSDSSEDVQGDGIGHATVCVVQK